MAAIANWFVTVSILFSLFTFSGNASLQAGSSNPARIELIASLKKRGKRTTSIKPFKSKRIASCFSSLWFQIKAFLFLFARQMKTQFSSNFKLLTSFENPEKVLILNYSPRNTGEFILNSFKR
jgi:hypothetical protein